MKDMEGFTPKLKLLTIINVAQAKPASSLKRKRPDWQAVARKAAKTAALSAPVGSTTVATATEGKDGEVNVVVKAGAEEGAVVEADEEEDSPTNAFEKHWAADGNILVEGKSSEELLESKWKKVPVRVGGSWGEFTGLDVVGGVEWTKEDEEKVMNVYNARLLAKLTSRPWNLPSPKDQESLLRLLASYRDLFYPKVNHETHDDMRATIAMHAMNHVHRTRTKVLKNNDHLSKASASTSTSTTPRNTQDQGFTRPKVLVLLPFRNSALSWLSHLTSLSAAETIENLARLESEYSLPEGAVDKLVENVNGYPQDHVETFKGNIDDSFRVGIKVTRKTVKVYSEFYSADVIVASPLGLRTSIEKEKDSDFLSSIEMLIVDQMDVMLMQNWEHVQFVLDRLNKTPSETHGSDLFRVKPWYLDQKSASLRQSILLSSYETPEMRALFTRGLHNVAGKVRAEVSPLDGVLTAVPKGIKQVFNRFDCADVFGEDDARFEYFTTKTLPMLRKSAVSSSQTIIFVPSYFDFVRLKRHMKKIDDLTFASISEFVLSTREIGILLHPDISRARGAFFNAEVSFLLITERFHFFRRYRLRGAKTFVFYAPPDHPSYYSEILSFPFAKKGLAGQQHREEEEVEAGEVMGQVVFSKFDFLRLERIVGTDDAKRMIGTGEGSRFTFV